MKRRNKKILITGGAGYIGLNLISFFLETKNKIYVIDNLSTSKAINKNIKGGKRFYIPLALWSTLEVPPS